MTLARKGNHQMIQALRKIPLFSDLKPEELAALEEVSIVKTVPRQTILFSEGDHSDSFYVIVSGKVSVGINDEEGREVILSILGPGEYFGEMALMDGEPRSAFVMTKDQSRLLMISKQDFKGLIDQHPELVFRLLKGVQKRLREANKRIESLALMDVRGRICRLLVHLAGGRAEKGLLAADGLTHQELASMVGASREMVSRVLKDLCNEELIRIDKKRITLMGELPEW